MDAPGYPLYAGEKLWTIMPAAYVLKLHAETFSRRARHPRTSIPARC